MRKELLYKERVYTLLAYVGSVYIFMHFLKYAHSVYKYAYYTLYTA